MMDYRAALQLAGDKIDRSRFLIYADGRRIGTLSFHRGFHSNKLIATVAYRHAVGEMQTMLNAIKSKPGMDATRPNFVCATMPGKPACSRWRHFFDQKPSK
jgi:hypothetical protein